MHKPIPTTSRTAKNGTRHGSTFISLPTTARRKRISSGKEFPNQNINCKYGFLFKADAETQADIVVSIDDTLRNRYWASYPLAAYVNDTSEWSYAELNLNFPASYTQNSENNDYVWNKDKEYLTFDDALMEIQTDVLPDYMPIAKHLPDSTFNPFELISPYLVPVVEYINANGATLSICDMKGTQVRTAQLSGNEGSTIVSLEGLATGVYFCIITTAEGNVKTQKLAVR